MGGLFYFYRSFLSACINTNWRTVIALLIAAQAAMLLSNGFRSTVDPYLGIAVMFCLLSASQDRCASNAQDFVGRASYHLFIGHMPIAAVLVIGLGLRPNAVVFATTVVVALALSAWLVPLERSINVVRQRIVNAGLAPAVPGLSFWGVRWQSSRDVGR
jgi:peptidoglycan/LPS O-acetylase OafA/YrhL